MLSLVSEVVRYLVVNHLKIVGKFTNGIDMGG